MRHIGHGRPDVNHRPRGRTTIVDGRVLMLDRELLTIDVPGIVKEMGERMPAL